MEFTTQGISNYSDRGFQRIGHGIRSVLLAAEGANPSENNRKDQIKVCWPVLRI